MIFSQGTHTRRMRFFSAISRDDRVEAEVSPRRSPGLALSGTLGAFHKVFVAPRSRFSARGPGWPARPKKGGKIWKSAALPPNTRHDPHNLRVVSTMQRPATNKPLRIWHFLALNGTVSEGLGFRKSIHERRYEVFRNEQVHPRPRRSRIGQCGERTAADYMWARKQPILPIL
jgi:hypothetical protein